MKNMMATINKKLKSKKGFTLIEMIVVVAIIAILIALIVPNVMRFIQTANQTAANANAKTIFVAAQTFVTAEFTAGRDVANGAGIDATTIAGFLAGNVLANGASGTYTVLNGAVTEATWARGDLRGAYPNMIGIEETTTPPTNP